MTQPSDTAAERWTPWQTPAETASVLMGPLRVSSADRDEDRRRAAMNALEACKFAPDERTAVAVLAACDVDDAEVRAAAQSVRTAFAVEAGRTLAEEFFSLSPDERRRRASVTADACATSPGLSSHYRSLDRLADVQPPRASSRPREIDAWGALVTIDPAAAGQAAASLTLQCHAAGGESASESLSWPGGQKVISRNVGPPLWLVPGGVVGGRVAEPVAAVSRPTGAAKSSDAPRPWGLLVACLLGVMSLLRACAAVVDDGRRPSDSLPAVKLAAEDVERIRQALPELADGLPPTSGSLPGPDAGALPDRAAIEVETRRRSLLRPPRPFSQQFVDTLDDRERHALLTLSHRDGLRGPATWGDTAVIERGEIAPGVPVADADRLRAAIDRVRAASDPSVDEMLRMKRWLAAAARWPDGPKPEPPWSVTWSKPDGGIGRVFEWIGDRLEASSPDSRQEASLTDPLESDPSNDSGGPVATPSEPIPARSADE